MKRRAPAAHASEPSIPGYHRWALLHRVGLGATWRAQSLADHTSVVVKTHDVGLQDERPRFLAESDAFTIAVPYLVTLLDAGLSEWGHPWLVRPYFAGGTISDRLVTQGPLTAAGAAAAGLAGTSALSVLHERRLTHGAVTPSNLLLDDSGAVLLADPGMASVREARARRGDHGALRHQPPEVLQGGAWSPSGDVYSLGSTLYTVLANRSPFEAEASQDVPQLLLRMLSGPKPELRRADVPVALRESISAALSRNPDDRPTLAELARVLGTGDEPGIEPPSERVETRGRGLPWREAPSVDPGDTPLGVGYLLHEVIGQGAMGKVWRGSLRAGGYPVAVKVLRPELAEQTEYVVRFLQELEVLRRINHPHVVRVRDQVWEGTTLAIVMDLIEGVDLRRFAPSAVPPATACELLAQVSSGLAAVHEKGVIHRDLKPENVLVEHDGSGNFHVRITDFGIVRLVGGPALTQDGRFMATLEYAAPERARAQPAGPPADVYALGVMAYELLRGRRPFESADPAGLVEAHLNRLPERPQAVPDPLWAVVAQCLDKDPAARPNAAELSGSLRSLATEYAGLPVLDQGQQQAPPASTFSPDVSAAGVLPPPAAKTPKEHETVLTVERKAFHDPLPAEPDAKGQAEANRPRWPVLLCALAVAGLLAGSVIALLARRGGQQAAPPVTTTTVGSKSRLLGVTKGARALDDETVELSFLSVRDRPGFQRYILIRDDNLLPDTVPPDVTSVRVSVDLNTSHCFSVVALFSATENLPTDPSAPKVCVQPRQP